MFPKGTKKEQPHSVVACRWVSFRIRDRPAEFAETEPGLQSALGPPPDSEYDAAKSTDGEWHCISRSVGNNQGNQGASLKLA